MVAVWRSSRLSRSTFHLIYFFLFFFFFLYESQAQNRRQACKCFHHELMDPQMHITCKLGVVFFHKHCKEKQQQQRSTVVTSVVGQAGQPTLFTHGGHFQRHFILLHFSKEEGCGSFKARTGGSTGSNLSLSTPWPICINSYVTMVSVYNGLSSTAAVRGTGTETGNAHGWKS